MNKIDIHNSPYLTSFYKLNEQKQNMTLSISPTIKRLQKIKKTVPGNFTIQQNLTSSNSRRNFHVTFSPTIKNNSRTKKLKLKKENINLFESVGNEKLKIKKLFRDLISWDNKCNVTDNYVKNNGFDMKKFKIPRLKAKKILNPSLITFNKFGETKKEPKEELKISKLKFSVFDKDFNKDKFREEQRRSKEILINEDIENTAKLVESSLEKRAQKIKMHNEIKVKDSLIIIHKKLILNRLKKKKFLELLNETYKLLEKARTETNLSVDILNERTNYIKKYYAAFINLFKGFPLKLLEEQIKKENQKSLGNIHKEKKKDSEESDDIIDDVEKQPEVKSERILVSKNIRTKNKMNFATKIKMYKEYTSIQDDIVKEIKNYEDKFDKIQSELDIIISNITLKIEEINDDSNKLKMIQKKLSRNQINYYLNKLKEGKDARFEGLSWIVIRLIELNMNIDSSLFPDFLDQEQIRYIIEISKYGYEINQLKIILDCLREKETGKANSNLKIFSSLTEEGLLSAYLLKKLEDNISDYINSNNILKTDQMLLKLNRASALFSEKTNNFSNEYKKLQLENKIVDLKSKQLKRRVSMIAIDKKYLVNNKNWNINNDVNKMMLLSSDKKSKYFYDILKLIEKINNLNNLIKEKREKEVINFNEKYKMKDLNDEAAKANYNKIFCALFGNSSFSI